MHRILAVIFLLSSSPGIGQQPVFSHSRWFKVEDGLPQSFISGLQQDKDGFLWVGTRDGLARYDGREFTIFRQRIKDSLSLSSNVITDLYLDDQNFLWIFYINEKLDCFDPRKMQVCSKDSFSVVRQLMSKLKIRKFSRDKLGRFWFNSSYRGIVCYDPLKNKTTWFDSAHKNLHSNNNLGFAEDPKGKVFVFTDKGVESLDTNNEGKTIFVPFDPALHFNFIPGAFNLVAAFPDGKLAITETNRVIVFDPVVKSFSSYVLPLDTPINKDIIQQLQITRDGLLYVVAGGGVFQLEKNNQFKWIWQLNASRLFANDCRSFLLDHSSVMWFGTNAGGMYKVDLQELPFNTRAYNINFTSDVLSAFTGSEKKIPPVLKEGSWAYSLRYCYDQNNSLWFTYKNKEEELGELNVFYLKEKSILRVPVPAGQYTAIKGLSLTPSGVLYGMDLRGNLWKWQNAFTQPKFIPSVLTLANTSSVVDMEADDKTIWVSTNKEGLYKIENNKVVKHFSTDDGTGNWPGNQLNDLCKDPVDHNILWIGTLGYGLIRLDKITGKIKVFTTENDLPNNTVYSIVPEGDGNLWISTNKGITRFTPGTESFSSFDVRDGLAGNEFNRFHHFKLPNGLIAFGGPDGFTLFDPSKFSKKDSFATRVGLTRLLINNKAVQYGNSGSLKQPLNQLEKLVLPYNKNFLQFEFAGLQFNKPEKIRYRYMLKGYDKDWIISAQYNIAGYTRLPPGRYTLLLNASNTSGNWSPEIKQLSIRIRPPIWATWWAYVIYFSIALLLLRLYWRYRTNRIRMQHEIALEQNKAKQLREVDEIKDRFFSNITHELRTPLTLILTPLEKLKNQQHFPAADQRILSNAYKNAAQLLRLINQLLDITKIESNQMKVSPTVGDFSLFVESCIQQFSMQAKTANIGLQLNTNNISGLYLFDEEKWEKIIFNLLSNAIKFSREGGEVLISISSNQKENEGQLIIELGVRDEGKGIPEEELPKLFDRFYMVDSSYTRAKGGTGIGLALVKELTAIMNGSIDVGSTVGKGSIFTVKIPVEKINSTLANSTPGNNLVSKISVANTELRTEKPLVLVVEDNEELLSFLAESLSDDWQVLLASNGKIGWEMVLNELPDFIISDLMMPEMDGFELCTRVKEDPRTGHIGFILLSARAAHESRLTGLKKGADEYLTKPFHLDELEQRLRNLFDQQKRLRNYLQKELLPLTPLRKLPHINDIFLQELYKQLDEMINKPDMSVDMLARSVNMSQRTLNRKIKAILNLPPVEFIRQYRLQKAALLLSSGIGITDTAYSVGFETASYFTQCFKEQFGKTPSEFASQKTA